MLIPLPLSQIIPVSVVITPTLTGGETFNQALFVGASDFIPSVGANSRVRLYTSLAAVAAVFSPTSPEYLAAQLYFAQYPLPSGLLIGRQDLTAIVTVAVGSGAGTSYKVGDLVTVTQTGGSLGQLRVTSVSGIGAVTGLALPNGVSSGTGYAAASNLPTSGGSGTALTATITVGETPVQAIQQCRLASTDWYVCMYVETATDNQLLDIADYIETCYPPSQFWVTTGATSILVEGASPASNIMALLQAGGYGRTLSVYSTTQSGAYLSNVYAAAMPLGVAMGLNTGLPGSYFDIMFKSIVVLPGLTGPEPLSIAQVVAICGSVDGSQVGLNGNAIVEYQNGAVWLQSGLMASGVHFDQVLFLDMLSTDMQARGVALLTNSPSIPLTDVGALNIRGAISAACVNSQNIGFIAPAGIWKGPQIGSGSAALATGAPLPKGYYLWSPSIASMTQRQRKNRVFPPITVALQEAGSGESLQVTVLVQQ